MAFTPEYTDDFNRSDSTDLGANWSETTGTGIQISGNTLITNATPTEAVYTSAVSSADSYTSFKVTTFANGVTAPGMYVRGNSDLSDGYILNVLNNKCDIYRKISGGFTALGTNITYADSATLSNGDTVYITVETTDASTVKISIYDTDGTTVLATRNDTSAARITSAGYAGLRFGNSGAVVDDFEAGTLGSAGSTSPSISPSLSPSKSPSLSPSQSPSVSASPSLSPSQSPSVSLSPSVSESPSLSPSISPSASPPAGKTYTRGDYAALPSDDTDLETAFTGQDYVDVETDDNNYVSQTATEEYPIFEFKDQNFKSTDRITPTWKGKSNLAPSTYPVVLQIYNRTLGGWETLDTNNTSDADTEFTLDGFINADLSDYYDGSSIISCRVLQDITDYGGGM